MHSNIIIKECEFGRGLFAHKPISCNQEILTFTGPLIDAQTVRDKGELLCANPLQIDDDLYVDLEKPGVLINHSCNPNSGIINDTQLIALRDIEPGEQLFYDYSTSVSGVKWTMKCLCGNPECRKIVGDFRHLPNDVKKRYLKLNIVQRFIAKDETRWGMN